MRPIAMGAAFAFLLGAWGQDLESPYLEIPLEGKFVDRVTAQGVENALRTAECMGLKHIVFTVDSKGGDPLAARDLHTVLGRYEKTFRYHAVVREATGAALAVVVRCDSVFIRPGGRVGGTDLALDETWIPGVETSVVLLNIALMAGEEARRHGRSPELVRAMIDPSEGVHVWTGADGTLRFTRDEPSLPGERMLLNHPAGKVLTLDDAKAVELGFARPFYGDLDTLGCELGLSGWTSAGDAGRTSMAEAAQAEQFRVAAVKGDRERFLIDQNRRRREATQAAIERFLKLAREWDPKLETYSTYKERGRLWDDWTYEGGRLTPEARRKWRDRTDIAVAALTKAHSGALEMRQLEKEARSLGQAPLYPEAKLDELRLDLELKIVLLLRERDKRFKDDR